MFGCDLSVCVFSVKMELGGSMSMYGWLSWAGLAGFEMMVVRVFCIGNKD